MKMTTHEGKIVKIQKPIDLAEIQRKLRIEEAADKLRRPTHADTLRYHLHGQDIVRNVVIGYVKGKQQVIHGSQAMNIQLPPIYRRNVKDWDIIARDALRNANIMENKLDEIFGSNMFYISPIVVRNMIVYRVKDRADGKTVVDYTPDPRLPPHVVIDGVKYETLKSLRFKKIRILRNPRLKFRWRKAREDLAKIDRALEWHRWNKKREALSHRVGESVRRVL